MYTELKALTGLNQCYVRDVRLCEWKSGHQEYVEAPSVLNIPVKIFIAIVTITLFMEILRYNFNYTKFVMLVDLTFFVFQFNFHLFVVILRCQFIW